jgi:hypothetical protein
MHGGRRRRLRLRHTCAPEAASMVSGEAGDELL